jgi:hypothetical protein
MNLFDLQLESEEPDNIVQPTFTLDDSEELTLDKIKEKVEQKKSIVEKLGYAPTIVVCFVDKQYSLRFIQNWMTTLDFFANERIKFVLSMSYSKNINFARCNCLGGTKPFDNEFKPFDSKFDYTHILWISSNVLWTVDNLKNLLLRNVDVVSSVCPGVNNSTVAAIKNIDVESFKKNNGFNFVKKDDIINETNLVEVQYSAMDFMLIKKGVFEKIKFPWFRTENDKDMHFLINEQMYFCNMARNSGFKIYIDPKVNIMFEYA